MRGLGAAEGRHLALLEQDVVEGKSHIAVNRRPIVGVRGLDDDVAVEAHFLAVVLADVRVVPVHTGVWERDAGGEAAADRDRSLGLVGSVVPVLEAQAVPVDGPFHVALVDDLDRDLRALLDSQGRARDRAVVGQHSHAGVAELLDHRSDPELELIAIGELHQLGGLRFREIGDFGWEVLGGLLHSNFSCGC